MYLKILEIGISESLSVEGFLVEREAMLQAMFPTSELMPGCLHDSLIWFLVMLFSF